MPSFNPPRDDAGRIVVDPSTRQPLSAFLPASAPKATDSTPAVAVRYRTSWPALAASVVAVLLLIVFVAWPRAPAAALPAPTLTATAPATRAPSSTVQALARAVVAYAEPGGAAIGAIEPGRGYQLLEESAGWRQLKVAGTGVVWVRSWEMDGVAPPTATPTATPVPTAQPLPTPAYVAPTAVPTRDWAQRPCEPAEVVGRARERGLVVESCLSQADAERLLAELLQQTAEAKP